MGFLLSGHWKVVWGVELDGEGKGGEVDQANACVDSRKVVSLPM